MIKIGIVGATGYTGLELLRLIAGHPEVELCVVTSRSEQGKPLAELFPSLRGHFDIAFEAPDSKSLYECDVVFFATPHTVSMQQVPELINAGVKVIDLSADFRLKDPAVWKQWYGHEHACPELLGSAVYGMPETNRDKIKGAQLVAAPGCYPTSIILALLPVLQKGAADIHHLIADAKSGVSGAGRTAAISRLHAEVSESFKAYAVSGHRHLPEICQELNIACSDEVALTFVPHLVPMIRGILATVYVRLTDDLDLQALYEQYYQAEPFVDVMPAGSEPDTKSVRGVNMCRIALYKPGNGDQAVILSTIDNLVKGAAGQAIQCMNIMLGLDESCGLAEPALYP